MRAVRRPPTLTTTADGQTMTAMQPTRDPGETFAILERIGPRGLAVLLRDMEEGDRFTLHPTGCLQHVIGICTCEPGPIVSVPLARA